MIVELTEDEFEYLRLFFEHSKHDKLIDISDSRRRMLHNELQRKLLPCERGNYTLQQVERRE